jgi:hypothetical protein
MRGVPALGNTAIDMLHEGTAAYWASINKSSAYIHEHTMPGTLLWKYIVNTCVLTKDLAGMEKINADLVPSHFLVEAFPAFIRRGENATSIGRPAYTKLGRCQWYDHSSPGGKLGLDSRKSNGALARD